MIIDDELRVPSYPCTHAAAPMYYHVGFINVATVLPRRYDGKPPVWLHDAIARLQSHEDTREIQHRGSYTCDGGDGCTSSQLYQHGAFMWPAMLTHYIYSHSYKPPENFLQLLENFE